CPGELLCHTALHQEAVRRHTGLARVPDLGDHCSLDRLVQVGVVEDEERCVAAELQEWPHHSLRGCCHHLATDLGGPGEGDHPDRRVFEQCSGQIARRTVHEVENAWGESGILHRAEHLGGGERGTLRHPGHDRAAGGQRRSHLPRLQGAREVPRGETYHHTGR